MKKKILIVDDSALMRRVLCDIINSDERFEVIDTAIDGAEGFKLICAREYDAVVLDVYMPRMTGLQMLKELQNSNIHAKVLMASTTTSEGARETLDALELGAIDFIKKPENVADARHDEFRDRFLTLLDVVANSRGIQRHHIPVRNSGTEKAPTFSARYDVNFHTRGESDMKRLNEKATKSTFTNISQQSNMVIKPYKAVSGNKIVAIASSTGGPRALQDVIPRLPANLNAPVLLVQHMPKGFTASLADRLNEISEIKVSEAKEGDILEKGHVYIAPGGTHMKAIKKGALYHITLSDEPAREGVKPCANYMYESLMDSTYDEVVCAVLTGMGADGTAGIKALNDKKKLFVVAQDEESSTVYGMPRAIANTGLCNSIVPLDSVAEQIIKNVGVR